MLAERDGDSTNKPEVEEDHPETEKTATDVETHDNDEPKVISPAAQSIKRPWYKKIISKKKIWTSLVVIFILAIVGAIPYSRYKVLGLFVKETYSLKVMDSQTNQPVSDAHVILGGVKATTSSKGTVSIRVGVGNRNLVIGKTYYKSIDQTVLVGLRPKKSELFKLVATGYQVPIKVVNLVTGQPVDNAEIVAANTSAKTNSSGQVSIVLPADKSSTSATLSGNGYNVAKYTIQVTTSAVANNTFKLTPSGTIYFLSNASGTIDVVSTNLDGTGRQTVLKGTGKEDPNSTSLLASRDWQYLTLNAKRDTNQNSNSIYLISTATNKLSTMDDGNATFTPVGWSGHYFVYTVDRSSTVQNWQSGQYALKSYNADTGAVTTLYQTTAQGTNQNDYVNQSLGNVYALNSGQILFSVGWQASYQDNGTLVGEQGMLISISPNGTNKTTIHSFPIGTGCQVGDINLSTELHEPDTLYIQDECGQLYEYGNGQVTSNSTLNNRSLYNQSYPTYLLSPSGKQTFWGEPRDGQTSLFVGDQSANSQQQIGSLTSYTPYGWYSDSYLLVEKSGSELYIMPVGGGTALKVSDYYKPAQNFNGYGGGYGGL
ncbi:MAG TPA: hypothetical protein VGS08_00095 [Candidatus Saccharimonadales bacterium]|nr:hypothetical protein [Candidatus Saccharimonadales bacterium]